MQNLARVAHLEQTSAAPAVGPLRARKSERSPGGAFRAGKLKNKETVVDGIDHAVEAFLGLFSGKNSGKMVVKLS